ncbi:uncharacterized protein LOC108217597 [Daucus carota subsp. sativus]|uniref:uncharacterized protein LOC108217597 n=1 Tax=Daucus carota subsp. sativus TaxID=79200 RepID=UPI00308380CA
MSTRKYESGYKKLQKKRRVEAMIEKQKGSLDKFVKPTKRYTETTSEPHVDESNDNTILDSGKIMEEENILDDHKNLSDSEANVEEQNFDTDHTVLPRNLDDPSNWKNISSNLRDLLVERGPVQLCDLDFPKDKSSRHFSSIHYTQKMANGEKFERKWFTAWIESETRLSRNKTIDKHIQDRINKDREHWRNVLKRIIAVVKTLGMKNLAFRGTNEKIYQENNGNFLALIEMIAEFDPIMQEHVRRIKDDSLHTHYLGHAMQNELINLLACEIKTKIIKKVQDAKYFSVILDCTPDVSHKEQMSIVIRCLDISSSPIKIVEYFIEFLVVDDTTGKGLFDAIVDEIKNIGLDIDDLRGQGYDNGSNMKGKHQGVQKRLLDINPRSFYTPCGCHSLNLVICDMANSCTRATDFFGVVQRIYTIFSSSTKRWKVLQDHIPSFTLKFLSQTRWESRIESIKAIRFQAPQI